eukprot:s1118_g6.t1
MFRWWLLISLSSASASLTCDAVELMQRHPPEVVDLRQRVSSEASAQIHNFNHTATESLQQLARKLLHAKKACLRSGLDCLPLLKQIRYRVWPFVRNLLGPQYQGFDPVDFHPQVAKAQLRCSARDDHSMVYMHVWKAAGYSLMENLRSIGSNYEAVDSFEDDFNWCENIDLANLKRRTTFTFVREPLSRFISGYAEIDRIYLGPRYEFFHQAEEGTLKKAQLFAERFFQDGLIFNGHVKPQSEYFAPFSPGCRLPIDFVGKVEHLSEDWRTLLESSSCIAAKIPYDNSLGQHPTEPKERQAMADMLESETNASETNASTTNANASTTNATAEFYVRDTSDRDNMTMSSYVRDRDNMTRSSNHLQTVLHKKDFAFLRAFCWISLPDYVMFDYDLPRQCDDPEIRQVMELTKPKQKNI